MKYFIFNEIETGRVVSIKAESFEEAEAQLPEDYEWDDWFEV
ncbi:hypothetical protein [Synechococcus phage MA10]|jgi:hypothetical protein|uniref:Uncharacterized protein n=1 Tax=Synechococcus phage S-H34 TaxID=2718942 RepID=A0A6G8R6G9_9CAUD|nr:hypothetical protein PQC15_gp104 [Synechococcus phage S-H34]QIN96975.1 hypothetical protein [Synechococcus phage S-H34]